MTAQQEQPTMKVRSRQNPYSNQSVKWTKLWKNAHETNLRRMQQLIFRNLFPPQHLESKWWTYCHFRVAGVESSISVQLSKLFTISLFDCLTIQIVIEAWLSSFKRIPFWVSACPGEGWTLSLKKSTEVGLAKSMINDLFITANTCRVTRNEMQDICGSPSSLGVHFNAAIRSSYYRHMSSLRVFLVGSLFENVWNKIT